MTTIIRDAALDERRSTAPSAPSDYEGPWCVRVERPCIPPPAMPCDAMERDSAPAHPPKPGWLVTLASIALYGSGRWVFVGEDGDWEWRTWT